MWKRSYNLEEEKGGGGRGQRSREEDKGETLLESKNDLNL